MFTFNFDNFKAIIEEKFPYIWPSTKSTPPTETNITSTFIEMYADDFYCYTEVPINNGRVDLVLLDRRQTEIIFCEFKSSKASSFEEIRNDIERLFDLTTDNLYYYSGDSPSSKKQVVFQWSENKSEITNNIEQLSNHFPEIKFENNEINIQGTKLFCLYSVFE